MDVLINPDRIKNQFLDVTSIPGTSRNERQIIDYIKNFVGKLGFDCYEDNAHKELDGNAGNLVCKIFNSNTKGKSFLLAAHVDTITLSCESPVIRNNRFVSTDDRILGADDRVGVAVLLEIMDQIADKKINYPNLEIVFFVAEEIGCLGSKNFNYPEISATEGFNFDCSAPVGQIVVQAPEAIDFEMRFIGNEAHSAVAPEKGINAILMASEAICDFGLPAKSEDTVFNIGQIKGGKKNNIVPGEVVVNGEIRGYDKGNIEEHLETLTKSGQEVSNRYGGKFEISHSVRYEAFMLSENSTAFKIAKAATEGADEEFLPIRYLAGSDANNFNQGNVAAVNIGLGYVNNHSSDEFIEVSDLIKDGEIAARIVQLAADWRN